MLQEFYIQELNFYSVQFGNIEIQSTNNSLQNTAIRTLNLEEVGSLIYSVHKVLGVQVVGRETQCSTDFIHTPQFALWNVNNSLGLIMESYNTCALQFFCQSCPPDIKR